MARRARKGPRTARPSTRGDRTCIACRGRAPRADLIRVVRAPSGEVLVDRYLRAPGRGAHLHYDGQCIREAVRRRAFARAFKAPVLPVDADALVHSVGEAQAAKIRDALALARRAGTTLAGAQALEAGWGKVQLLVLAEDIAAGSADKLRRRAAATQVPVYIFGTALALGHTLGSGDRVAVGVTDAQTAARLDLEFARRDRVLVAAHGESR